MDPWRRAHEGTYAIIRNKEYGKDNGRNKENDDGCSHGGCDDKGVSWVEGRCDAGWDASGCECGERVLAGGGCTSLRGGGVDRKAGSGCGGMDGKCGGGECVAAS